jgi:hypothetical protein
VNPNGQKNHKELSMLTPEQLDQSLSALRDSVQRELTALTLAVRALENTLHQQKTLKSSKMAENLQKRLNTRGASAHTGIPANTLRKFRSEGRGPIYSKPAGRALYLVRDLDAFMESGHRVPATRKAQDLD